MSATHRSIARLPLHIFQDLCQDSTNVNDNDPTESSIPYYDAKILRTLICAKLKDVGKRKGPNMNTVTPSATTTGAGSNPNMPPINKISGSLEQGGVTTVGQFLKLSLTSVLHACDPLLTFDECRELKYRICMTCSAESSSALSLLHDIQKDATINTLPPPSSTSTSTTTTSSNDTPTKDDTYTKQYLKSNIPSLDQSLLKGGFRTGTITELFGPNAVGKSQLAMQLCITTGLQYRGEGSIYIDTEKKLNVQRMAEIAREQLLWRTAVSSSDSSSSRSSSTSTGRMDDGNEKNHYDAAENTFSYGTSHDSAGGGGGGDMIGYDLTPEQETKQSEVLENVLIHSPTSTTELLSVLNKLEEEILSRSTAMMEEEPSNTISISTPNNKPNSTYPIKLIVLDSIAAPARRDFGEDGSAFQRVTTIFQIAQTLKRIADEFNIAVVVINQIGSANSSMSSRSYTIDDISTTSTHGTHGTNVVDDYSSYGTGISAALGTSWQHCISTRICMEFIKDPLKVGHHHLHESMNTVEEENEEMIRRATIIKSNVTGHSSILLRIATAGVCEVRI